MSLIRHLKLIWAPRKLLDSVPERRCMSFVHWIAIMKNQQNRHPGKEQQSQSRSPQQQQQQMDAQQPQKGGKQQEQRQQGSQKHPQQR